MKRPGRVRGWIENEEDVYDSYVNRLEPMISIARRYNEGMIGYSTLMQVMQA